ncbi:hypothetical protein WJX73_007544 [Symbiochloris irregularis]|uniref:Diacylglycerol kinase n=1 Tax=Symbiochloris irregularis TaxID=706552 RepID=A0AAW1NFC8_9CHLO
MFRQGGWAVPLSCEDPALLKWLKWMERFCVAFGLPYRHQTALDITHCNSRWSPLAIAAVTVVFATVGFVFLFGVLKSLIRWQTTRRGSTHVAQATLAAAELRKSSPELFPSVPHSWYRLQKVQLRTPLLCAVCHGQLEPEAFLQKVDSCEVCGVIAHEGCARKVPDDCRPVAEIGEDIVHQWRPAGAVLQDKEDELGQGILPACLYCQRPCEADLFAMEPTWQCSWHLDQHVRENGTHVKENGSHDGGGSMPDSEVDGGSPQKVTRWADGKKPPRRRRHTDAGAVPSRLSLDSRSLRSQADSLHTPDATLKGAGGSLRTAARRVNSLSSIFNVLASAIGTTGPGSDAGSDEEWEPHSPTTISREDVARLDTCTLGPHRRLVLPPTAVRLVPPESWSSLAKNFLRAAATKSARKRSGELTAALHKHSVQQQAGDHDHRSSQELRDRLTSAGVGSTPGAEGAGGTQKRSAWWAQAQVQWDSYRVEREHVPLGWRPLLVFLNTRSGPQLGARMRRRFLRCLNPLQVVELPREDPTRALLFFAGLPNLQVLVLGGDGTVGWILSALDTLQASSPAELPEHWTPPPVAVLPLGTGNDLARCLNWGGSAAFSHRSLSTTLHDVEHATIALLDRWKVSIEPQPVPQRGLQRTLSNNSSRKPEPKITKVMNNYLGIGVDAKVSLEFHTVREQYPDWFRSQIGNKLWYTGMGAKDIIGQSSQQLSKKLVVECDGVKLDLADDIEGLLVINIPSYMGGVNLWASSAASPSRRRFAPQSFSDGLLEVVAVFGSWHLGQLQVGLSRAIRLAQCHALTITASQALPVQIDGEPWQQPPATLRISLHSQAFMLRRVESQPLARVAVVVADTLERATQQGVITQAQRHQLTVELAASLNPIL